MNKIIRIQCDCGRFFNKNSSDLRYQCDQCSNPEVRKISIIHIIGKVGKKKK